MDRTAKENESVYVRVCVCVCVCEREKERERERESNGYKDKILLTCNQGKSDKSMSFRGVNSPLYSLASADVDVVSTF